MKFAVVPDPKLGFEPWRTEDLRRACDAVHCQLVSVTKAWGWPPAIVNFYEKYDDVPVGHVLVLIARSAPEGRGLLGRHEKRGAPFGRVFVDPIFAIGGDVIAGTWSVSKVLSHEIIEILGNPQASFWVMMPDGRLTPRELCDAVESTYATVTLSDGFVVPVSNYLLPAWFDYEALDADAQYDALGALTMPFAIAEGGYMAVYGENPVFGAKIPDWRREHVEKVSRLARMNERR